MNYDLGYKFWIVDEVHTPFSERERITKKDENGVVWTRREKPLKSYVIRDAEIIGKMMIRIQGYSMWDDEPFYDQYAVQYSDGRKDTITDDEMEEGWQYGIRIFHFKKEAEDYVAQMTAEAEKL
jgi:hypothetical protein